MAGSTAFALCVSVLSLCDRFIPSCLGSYVAFGSSSPLLSFSPNLDTAAEVEKDKTIAEQADTIELLKGCIMELADVVYGDGEEDTTA